MNRNRPKQIVIRASETEFAKIKSNVEKSKLNQNEYLLKAVLNKEIVVMEGLTDLTIAVKRIGNNLNQLTRSVHEGKANCKEELAEIDEEMKIVWQLLRSLAQKQA